MTPRTVHRIVIPAAGPTLKKCAPLFHKLFGYRRGRKLLFKLSNALLEIGVFFLSLRYFLFEQAEFGLKERNVFLEDSSGAALGNEPLNLAEDRNGHKKPNIRFGLRFSQALKSTLSEVVVAQKRAMLAIEFRCSCSECAAQASSMTTTS